MSRKKRRKKQLEEAADFAKNVLDGFVSVMVKNSENDPEKQDFIRSLGLLAGHFSKSLLKGAGCEVNYKINGEKIEDIKSLNEFGIKQKIRLAIIEERYEDAAALKKILLSAPKKTIYLDQKE